VGVGGRASHPPLYKSGEIACPSTLAKNGGSRRSCSPFREAERSVFETVPARVSGSASMKIVGRHGAARALRLKNSLCQSLRFKAVEQPTEWPTERSFTAPIELVSQVARASYDDFFSSASGGAPDDDVGGVICAFFSALRSFSITSGDNEPDNPADENFIFANAAASRFCCSPTRACHELCCRKSCTM
jgi:hypothetical protein